MISQIAKNSQSDFHVHALQQIFALTEKDEIIAALQSTDNDVERAAELLAHEDKGEDFGEATETIHYFEGSRS